MARFPDNRVERTETVAIRRLDDVLGELVFDIESPRICLKLDNQDFDLVVTKGAEPALKKIGATDGGLVQEYLPGHAELHGFDARISSPRL